MNPSMQSYFAVIKRRKWLILASVLVICGFVGYQVKTSPPIPTYEATCRIFVATDSGNVSPRVVAQMATSNTVLSNVISDRGLDMSPRELLDRLSADVERSSSGQEDAIVVIRARAQNPEDAINTANTAADYASWQSHDVVNIRNINKTDALTPALKSSKEKLTAAAKRLEEFKSANQSLLLPLDYAMAKQQIVETQRQVLSLDSDIAANDALIRDAKMAINDEKTYRARLNSFSSPAVSDLRRQLMQVETDLAAEKLKHTDKHPTVIALSQRIKQIKASINKEASIAKMGESGRGTEVQSALSQRLGELMSTGMSLKSKRDATAGLLSQMESELPQVPKLETELAKLNREYDEMQTEYLNTSLDLAKAKVDVEVAKVQKASRTGIGLVDHANIAVETPGYRLASPKVKMVIAFLVSLLMGISMAFILENLDTRVKDVSQLEALYGVVVLGVIPMMKKKALQAIGRVPMRTRPRSSLAERYRQAASNLMSYVVRDGKRRLIFSSATEGEGKTAALANIGVALAEAGTRVALVDCNVRKPSLHSLFGLDMSPGICQIADGTSKLADFGPVRDIPGLYVIPAGAGTDKVVSTLRSERLDAMVETLLKSVDVVIMDSPAISPYSDVAYLSRLADGIVVVSRAGGSFVKTHDRIKKQLEMSHAKVVAALLNAAPEEMERIKTSDRRERVQTR